MKAYTVVAKSSNVKLTSDPKTRPVISTWQSRATCPKDCQLLGVCYPNKGRAPMVWNPLKGRPNAKRWAGDILAAIMRSKLKRPRVRLSVAGDITATMLEELHKAIAEARAYGKRPLIWGYTRRWRDLDSGKAHIVGTLTIRASVHTLADKAEAEAAGWHTAITVDKDAKPGLTKVVGQRPVLTCPEQTGEKPDCFGCTRCIDSAVSIGFRWHSELKNEKGAL